MPELTKKQNALIIVLICVLYVAFRIWGMTDSCLWFDEIFSVHAAEHSWETIISFGAKDLIHPPLFYVLLKLWITFGGESVFWLRLLPVIFSILALFPFWMICRELKLKQPATILAMSLFAVNGSLTKYGQEVRMYSLLLFLSLFSIWLFSRFYFRGKNFWLLTAVNILLVYTHYFGWLIVIAEVVAILIAQRIKILRILLMLGVTIAAFVPWIFAIFRFAESGPGIEQNIGWIARPGFAGIFEFAFDVVEPFYYQQSSADPNAKFFIVIPLLLLIAAAMISYFVNFKDAEEKNGVYLMSVFSLAPLTIAFVASWMLPVSIWGSRHLIIVFAPMMIIVAIFITSVAIKPIRFAFIASVYLLITVAFVMQMRAEKPQFIWCAWENLAVQIPADKPQTVYVFEDLVAYHFWFATRNRQNFQIVKINGMPEMTEDKAYFLPRGFDGVKKIEISELKEGGFWIAYRSVSVNESKEPLKALIEQGYRISDKKLVPAERESAIIVSLKK
jgi:uncharacterized membrane protein